MFPDGTDSKQLHQTSFDAGAVNNKLIERPGPRNQRCHSSSIFPIRSIVKSKTFGKFSRLLSWTLLSGIVACGCAPQSDSSATITLKIARNYQVKDREDYLIHQDGNNISSYNSGGTGQGGSKFTLRTTPTTQIQYEGRLSVPSPEHVEIQLELKNDLAFRLVIEGIGELIPIDNGEPFSLDSQISPGSHSIRIRGRALAKQWDEGRPSDYAFDGPADRETSGKFRGETN